MHPRRRHGPRQDLTGHHAPLDLAQAGHHARRRASRQARAHRLPDFARRKLGRRMYQVAQREGSDDAHLRSEPRGRHLEHEQVPQLPRARQGAGDDRVVRNLSHPRGAFRQAEQRGKFIFILVWAIRKIY